MKPAKFITAWLTILILVVPAEARQRTPQQQAKKIALNSRVRVELKNRASWEGRLGQMTETHFTLEPLNPGKGLSKEILFQDVSKIRSIDPTKKDALLRPLPVLALIPVAIVCGIGWIFNKNGGDL